MMMTMSDAAELGVQLAVAALALALSVVWLCAIRRVAPIRPSSSSPPTSTTPAVLPDDSDVSVDHSDDSDDSIDVASVDPPPDVDSDFIDFHGQRKRRFRIAMCTDFCYPNMGGVEMHLYQLSQTLLQLGHKVVIVTHQYGDRKGVRHMSSGLKTYYVCHKEMYNGVSLPTLGVNLPPILRAIFTRERIEIVHMHQAFSTMGHEALVVAANLGLRTCFTDHSLFGFADASSILTNKVLKFTLSNADHVICVSHTSKENTCLRAAIEPELVSVIPNAIDGATFVPDAAQRDPRRITIVIMSRLVYRKGLDLLVDVIPRVCAKYPAVHWLIGGDGPKRLELDEMRERYQLYDRVELLGAVEHEQVRDVLVRGDIFVNASLTEAFCIAIVEAVAAGLSVVSTNVGGVPEVFPDDMMRMCSPEPDDIMAALDEAIADLPNHDGRRNHERVCQMYSWVSVAQRTEIVYNRIMATPRSSLAERLRRSFGTGLYYGKLNACLVATNYLSCQLLEYFYPRASMDIAPDWPCPFPPWSAAVKNGSGVV
jgi:phosphatidylinositol glycan class A protein